MSQGVLVPGDDPMGTISAALAAIQRGLDAGPDGLSTDADIEAIEALLELMPSNMGSEIRYCESCADRRYRDSD